QPLHYDQRIALRKWRTAPCGRGFHEKACLVNHNLSSADRDGGWPTNGRRHSVLPSSFLRKFLERFFLPSPNRPASIRTLSGAVGPGALWCPQFKTGAAISESN